MENKLIIFSGNANPVLAKAIVSKIGVKMGNASITKFADGECQVKILDNVRGADCFIIQPTSPAVNENVMELLVIIDALTRASAHRVTAVMPYYGYGRQDRKAEPRVPISAKLVANLITASGADRVLAMDLHASQIQGFFDIPVDHLFANPVFLEHFRSQSFRKKYKELCMVAPDAGGVERARAMAKRLQATLVIADKRRPAPNHAAVMRVIGNVKGKSAVIIDDIVDTGSTLIKVADALRKEGAKSIIAACTHGVLSGNSIENIEKSEIEHLIITDSIPLKKKSDKIVVLSVAGLLARAIESIHLERSISELFA
jgi:ribose-phosphate pyrophosphokinase